MLGGGGLCSILRGLYIYAGRDYGFHLLIMLLVIENAGVGHAH